MVMFIYSLYLESVDDKAIADFFLLNQQMGSNPKLRMYPKVESRSMYL